METKQDKWQLRDKNYHLIKTLKMEMEPTNFFQVKVLGIKTQALKDKPYTLLLRSQTAEHKLRFQGQQFNIQQQLGHLPISETLELTIKGVSDESITGSARIKLAEIAKSQQNNHVVDAQCIDPKKIEGKTNENPTATIQLSLVPSTGQESNNTHSGLNPYDLAYQKAASPQTRQEFWKEQARKVEWFKFPETILDSTNAPFYRWFPDGLININYNQIDRHLNSLADNTSLIWVSNIAKQEKTWTLRQVYEDTCKMALLLQSKGVKKGDRVIIYMPMIPEALFSAWACARIGAIHSIVFGGFSPKQLGSRIKDATPKVIVAASCGLEPHKEVNYVDILTESLGQSNQKPTVLIYQRPGLQKKCNESWTSFSLQNLEFKHVECEPMAALDPLYILYTSGTTGQPKGIVRDQGGTAVALEWVMNHVLDIHPKDVYFASSDIGWVVGHNYTVYGPLLRGAATVLYEGKPTYPNPGALWAIIEKYKVKGLYTSPTALRAIRKEDSQGQWVEKYNISSLNAVTMAGQRCDIPTYEWIGKQMKVLINDNYWQTETGWGIACNYKNLHTFPPKPGSTTKPCPGFLVEILSPQNQKMPTKSLGKVCVKLPMPPSFMLTLYKNDQAFLEKYLKETPGYYTTGDAGYFDQDGYLNVMTRLDDIINTAGHRLSTASMEEQLMGHPNVAEAAVVAKIDELKGEVPIGFVVLKSGCSAEGIQKELVALIRKEIGPVAAFQHVVIIDKLPKTRSGKILRNILRRIIEGEEYKYPATIEDESVLKIIEEKVKAYGKGLGEKKKLVYRGDMDLDNTDFHDLHDVHDEAEEK